jgi:hypothetical protein
LSTCLAASRLIYGAQGGSGRVWPASKTLLNRDDEPMIGLSADIGASGRSALYSGNQMRVAWLDHNDASISKVHCCKRSAADELRKYRNVKNTMEKTSARR